MTRLSHLARFARRALLPLVMATSSFAAQTLNIGLIPAEDSQAMIESSKDVLDALQQQIGMPVKPFVATD